MRLHRIQRAAVTPRQRWLRLASLVGVPIAVAILVAALQGPAAPLGDDWIFFSHFDHISIGEAMLTNSSAGDGERFRPLCYAHIWLERHLLGSSFAINRWIGVVYLGLCGSMLALLLTALRTSVGKATLGGILLLVHPAQAEVHGWATARIDTMATCFGLLALWLHCRGRRVLYGWSLLAACLCKESAYPLVFLPAIHTYLLRRDWRAAGRDFVPGAVALAATAAAKLVWVGSIVPAWAMAGIPLTDRLRGWITYFQPLLLLPQTKGAAEGPLAMLGTAFTGLVLLGLLLPALRVLVVHPTTDPERQPLRQRVVPPVLLLIGFVLALLVTGGVPVRDDFSGGRLWLLPCAFLVGFFVHLGSALPLSMAVLPALLLLLGNLAPYREANQMMSAVLDRVTAEIRDPKRAIRISGLPKEHGPVPVFYLMTEYFCSSQGPTFDRVLLWRVDQEANAAELARWDALWLERMAKAGHEVRLLRWQDNRLQETRTPPPTPGR